MPVLIQSTLPRILENMSGIITLGLAYIFSQFYRSFMAVLVPNLKLDLGVNAETLSQASGAFFIAFALMQFVVGASLDKYGPRRTVSFLLGFFGTAGASVFSMANSGAEIIAGMTLLGAGCSGVLMSSVYIYARTFNPVRFALYCSILIGVGTTGNIAGATPLAIATETFGWRATLMGLAITTFIISTILYFLVKDPARDESDDIHDKSLQGFRGTLHILKMPVMWALFPILFVHYGIAAGARGLWVGPYFEDIFNLSVREIGTVTFYMSIAMVIGTWVYGPLDKWLNTRKWVVVAGSATMMAGCAVLAFQAQPSHMMAVMAFICIGFFGMGFPVIMAHGKSFVRPSMVGRGVTLMNFFSIGGAGLMQFYTGDLFNTATSPATGYQSIMIFYTIVLCIAIFIYYFSKDAKPNIFNN